jgi:hypothetical protein
MSNVRFNRLARFLTVVVSAVAVGVPALPAPAVALSTRSSAVPYFNGSVHAIAYRGGTVYVGGAFTSATWGGRTYPRARLAAFDARTGALLGWSPAADRTVRALAVSGTAVYAAGDFGVVAGVRRDNLARLDAVTGRPGPFAHTVSGTPYALWAGNGRLYVGGSFSAVDGNGRRNLAAFSLTTGALDGGWRPAADAGVYTLAGYGARVYAGGAFHKINGVSGTFRVAALSVAGGAVDRGFLPRSPARVNSLAVDGAGVYAATGGQGGRAIAWTSRGAVRWQRLFDGDATAVVTLNGVTYVGGHFDRACLTLSNGAQGTCTDGSRPRVKLAAVSSSGALTGWAPQANGVIGVRVLAVDRALGAIGAGGDFTVVAGQVRKRYASFR